MNDTRQNNEFEKRIEWVKGVLDNFLPWFLGACVALTSQWAAPAIQDIIEKRENIKYDIFYIIVFVLFLVWFAKITRQHFKARTKELRVVNNPGHCSHLILFLSTSRELKEMPLKKDGLETLGHDLEKIQKFKEEQKKSGNPPLFWSWEMPLRAIYYHVKNPDNPILQQIIIVCSKESLKQYPDFQRLLNRYLKNSAIKIKLLLKTDSQETSLSTYNKNTDLYGIDFEDFDDLSKHLHNAINKLVKQGVKREQIMIDFTSGQKVTSVVAATLTFNSNIKAQYISTQTLNVKGYDIVYGTVQIPELG